MSTSISVPDSSRKPEGRQEARSTEHDGLSEEFLSGVRFSVCWKAETLDWGHGSCRVAEYLAARIPETIERTTPRVLEKQTSTGQRTDARYTAASEHGSLGTNKNAGQHSRPAFSKLVSK
jgi:hypothetical protein